MDRRLDGKKSLVTGGSRGIGYAIGSEFAARGADVALLARSEDDLRVASNSIKEQETSVNVVSVAADVRQLPEVEEAVASVIEDFGGLDVLVNAAGIASLGEIDRMAPEEWRRMVEVNLFGVYHCCRAVWTHFRGGEGGSIINISSGSGRRAHAGLSAYCSSKFGLMGLTDSLQKEGRPHGISCNVICPGPTDTDQRRSNFPGEDPADLMDPEQVAKVAVFFASDEAKWVSGPGLDVRREPI